MCFSSGLDRIGSKDIGRRFCGCEVSLDLGRGITLASFKREGKIHFSMHKCYIYVSCSTMNGNDISSRYTGMFSGPRDLEFFRFVIRLPTSSTVRYGI